MVIIGSIMATYYQVVDFDFINLDDPTYILRNSYVQSGLSFKSITWALTSWSSGLWMPLTWLSFMVDFELYGLWSGGYHLTNVFLHIISALLLFHFLRRVTGKMWRSACVATLFALHPLQVESVAWIAERKDVLSTLFWLLTMLAYVWFLDDRKPLRYIVVIVLFVGGLMAKPMLITLPFALLLIDYWPLGRFETACHNEQRKKYQKCPTYIKQMKSVNYYHINLILEKIPLFVLTLLFSVVTFLAQRHVGAVSSLETISLKTRVANALASYIKYIYKMVWPYPLGVLYPHPGNTLSFWHIVVSVVVLTGFTVLVVWAAKKKYGYLTTGWLWYVGTLFPVIGVVQFGAHGMADRFTYIPIIGISIMVVWGISDLPIRWNYHKYFLPALSIVVFIALGILTWHQVGLWSGSQSLFQHTLSFTDDNFLVHNALGGFLLKKDRFDEAIKQFKMSLEINPYQQEAYYNLSLAYSGKGMTDEAEARCRAVLAGKPEFVLGHIGLGKMLYENGRFEEAEKEFTKALKIDKNCTLAHLGLGKILILQDKLDKAINVFQMALKIEPNLHNIRASLGVVYYQKGYFCEAIDELQTASRGCPDDPDLFFNLGKALKAVGRLDDAIESFRHAQILKENDAEINAALGTVMAMKGRTGEAIGFLEQAVRLDPELAEARYNLGLALELAARYPEAVLHFEKILTLPKAVKYYDLAREAQSRINDRSKE